MLNEPTLWLTSTFCQRYRCKKVGEPPLRPLKKQRVDPAERLENGCRGLLGRAWFAHCRARAVIQPHVRRHERLPGQAHTTDPRVREEAPQRGYVAVDSQHDLGHSQPG